MLAFSLDGDGDRVIMADEKGQLINGDHILGICALSLKKKEDLKGNKVSATVLSNKGLEIMLKKNNIRMARTEVGDRNIVEYMRRHNISLGGEPSGHIIFLNQGATGDGCVAALNVLAVMRSENKKLSELSKVLKLVPQVQISLKIKHKKDLSRIPGYGALIKKINLKNKGRVYVRYSGTEPVIRILVEGENLKSVKAYAKNISAFLKNHLN